MTLATILVSLLPLLTSVQGRGTPQEPTFDAKAMRRDLETMRRILDRQVSGRTAGAEASVLEARLFLASASLPRSEAFYLPGEGALFLLRASHPVAPPAGEASEKGTEEKEPTLWERVQAEIDGRQLPEKNPRAKPYKAEKVEEIEKGILEALGKYGENIGQIADGEHLTVVVTGTGAGETAPEPFRISGRVARDESPGPVFSPNVAVVATSDRDATVLTIRVSRADAAAAAAGRIAPEEFRKRARIARY